LNRGTASGTWRGTKPFLGLFPKNGKSDKGKADSPKGQPRPKSPGQRCPTKVEGRGTDGQRSARAGRAFTKKH